MAEFYARWTEMKSTADIIGSYSSLMKNYSDEALEISGKLPLSDNVSVTIRSNLKKEINNIIALSEKITSMSSALDNIANKYQSTENELLSAESASDKTLDKIIQKIRDILHSSLNWEKGAPGYFLPIMSLVIAPMASGTLLKYLNKGSTVSGENGSAGYSLVNANFYNKGTLSVDRKDGKINDLSGKYTIGAKVSAIEGQASGYIGALKGSVKGSVSNAAVEGSAGFSIYKDGKITPNINAGVSASASVLHGEAGASYGSDDNNVHIGANGEVLSAKAYAEGQAGVITYKDENGVEHTTIGAKGKVGAEAYAVQGSVSCGITLFGVKFDVKASGKAGGAGASASGSVTTNGISGEIGAGLGIGGSIGVNVDWSNFWLFKMLKK